MLSHKADLPLSSKSNQHTLATVLLSNNKNLQRKEGTEFLADKKGFWQDNIAED